MNFQQLAELYEALESTTLRLEKTRILADFLAKAGKDDLNMLVLLVQGKIFPSWSEKELGIAAQLMIQAISRAYGVSKDSVISQWKKTGDLGLVAEKFANETKQRTIMVKTLTVKHVFETLKKVSTLSGKGSQEIKLQNIAGLLKMASPRGARYIARTTLGDLRVGVAEGVMRDSIAKAFSCDVEVVEQAHNLTNDFGEVAITAKTKGIKGLSRMDLEVDRPLKVMLFQKAEDVADAFERVGRPALFEYKYDGFRLQIHGDGKTVNLFTRRLENVTKQFPDVVDIISKNVKAKSFIIDCEAIGKDPQTGKFLPFQEMSRRIKRKYEIKDVAKELPVVLKVFDILMLNGKTLINEPMSKRRQAIEKIVKPSAGVTPSDIKILNKDGEAQKFFEKALKEGMEGLMAKNMKAPYKPGSRVGYGVKLKTIMETLDLVIVGAEWGKGKRSQWLSSFDLACYDSETGEFLTMGKLGTGIKEKAEEGFSFGELTTLLKPLIIDEKGKHVRVKPSIVIEVAYEEIQKSPTYTAKYALRFPRLVRLRDDKSPDEVSSIERIIEFYSQQRGR